MQRTFEHWQRTGDSQALAALFDARADGLLRLAIHLVSDAALAEDLVQATFLAAIEQRAQIDTSRPLEPWLAGVLTRKARAARRSAARRPDPREVLARAERSPLDAAIAGEFSGELARALDRLREPYRSVLVLRLRHGLAPADIAHALERSPSAVRVQLHRGLEELRRNLPAGVAGAVLLAVTAPRGLAAVREAVVAAATQPAVWTAATLAGGVLMTKQLILGGVALVLLATWAWFANAPAAAPAAAPSAGEPALIVAGVEEPADSPQRTTLEAAPGVLDAAERVVAARSAPRTAGMLGRVLDSRTGAGLAGARLSLYPARTGRLSDVAMLLGRDARHASNGSLWTYDFLPQVLSARDGKPVHGGQDSVEETLNLAPVRIYDVPAPGERAVSAALSDAQGSFELAAPAEGGVIVVELAGFAQRCFAAPQPEGPWAVPLLPAWTLTGVVIDTQGEALQQSLRLAFSASSDTRVSRAVGDETEYMSEAAWRCESETDGSFSLEVGGGSLQPHVLSQGWVAGRSGIHPVHRRSWIFDTQFTPDEAGETAWVVARAMPLLEVRDAQSGAPIEDLCVVTYDSQMGYPQWCGRFRAPGGFLTLGNSYSGREGERGHAWRVQVAARGYRAGEVLLADSHGAERQLVELEPGAGESIRGHVFDAGVPLAGALVAVSPHSESWRLDSTSVLDGVQTGADGSFEIPVPPGRWIVLARSGGRERARVVELPADDVRLDLADPTGLSVRIVDEFGQARADHPAMLISADGRIESLRTDDQGVAQIRGLEAGAWTVYSERVPSEYSFSGDIQLTFELAPGEWREVVLVVPLPDTARRTRLSVVGEASLVGWRAHLWERDWVAIEADGTLPDELSGVFGQLVVEAPDGRRWQRGIDLKAPREVYELDPSGPGYVGSLRRSSDGESLAGVRVTAWHPGRDDSRDVMSVVTDERGEFRVRGHAKSGWMLTFDEDDDSGSPAYSIAYQGLTFSPEADAGSPSTAIDVSLPLRNSSGAGGLESRRIEGRVLGPGGEGLVGVTIQFTCRTRQRDGWLAVRYGMSLIHTAVEGRFSVLLPAVELIDVLVSEANGAVFVSDPNDGELLRTTWDAATLAGGGERLLLVP